MSVSAPVSERKAAAHGARVPALDGLRGVAILSVILFHASIEHGYSFRNWVGPGLQAVMGMGWGGVDIFFVLSGFLITGILLDTRDSPHYFRNFYARRVLRIFPLYYAFLFFLLWILPYFKPFDTPRLQYIQQHQIWLWTFTCNIGYMVKGHVFTTAGFLMLDHLWSLAVEEQFYLVWPLLAFLLPRKFLGWLCLALVAESLGLRLVLAHMPLHHGALFFPTPCRLDALGIGALLAIMVRSPRVSTAYLHLGAKVMGGLAFLALVGLFFWTKPGLKTWGLRFSELPSLTFGITLFGLLAGSILALAVTSSPSSLICRALQMGWLRVLGKYSYAMYLFHQALIPAFNLLPLEKIHACVHSYVMVLFIYTGVMLGVSLAAAFLSWHLYEKHFLRLKVFFPT